MRIVITNFLCLRNRAYFYCACIHNFVLYVLKKVNKRSFFLSFLYNYGLCTVTRRSAEFRHPARMTQDSSCWVGENDCFIWAGNLRPQVPKFSVITGNFRRFFMKKGRTRMVGSNSVPLDYYSCPLPLDHSYHVLKVKKYTIINIE